MSFDFKFNFFPTEDASSPMAIETTTTAMVESPQQTGRTAKQLFPGAEHGSKPVSSVVAFSNNVTLYKHDATMAEINAQPSLKDVVCQVDLKPGVYEGGFKLWECAIDLVNYLIESDARFEGLRVLEAGCGHGLPGILALQRGAQVDFQDYNEEVVSLITIPNVWKNTEDNSKLRSKAQFFSGDWSAFSKLLEPSVKYDLILSSDTLYSERSEESLYSLLQERLAPTGIAILASKAYYFGVGGGTRSFCESVEKRQLFAAQVERRYEDGLSNIRELLKLRFK